MLPAVFSVIETTVMQYGSMLQVNVIQVHTNYPNKVKIKINVIPILKKKMPLPTKIC